MLLLQGIAYVVQTGLKFEMLLPQPPWFGGYRHGLSHLAGSLE